jgi:tetratricopeptide (TPR) repeat protein/transcriptional regulator with XRE-family HTH domain
MGTSFGALLRSHRRAVGLTQEGLAERASLSGQAVGALERGDRRFPHRDTVARLADALELAGEQRAVFVLAARRSTPRLPARPDVVPTRPDVVPVGSTLPPEQDATPRQLPPDLAHFTGRESDVKTMIEQLGRTSAAAVSAIAGMGGVGKTALAVHVGHDVADQFPDGQLYVDLRGSGPDTPMPAREALCQLLRSLAVSCDEAAAEVAEIAALYRSSLAGRRVLVVLDNAADAGQVAPLLPGTAGSAAIITSRRALTTLPQVEQVRLDVLTECEAVQLLAATAGPSRVEAEPEAATAVVRLCGRLPLAIHLVGARLAARPHWPVAHLARRLADEHRRLDEVDGDDVGVRASFAVSIDQLTTSQDPRDRQAARAQALLGLPDGPDSSVPVAARLLELTEDATERILERLVDLHLLMATSPGRYVLHDLLRVYARERAAATVSAADRATAITRVLELYVAVAWRSHALLSPRSVRGSWADDRWAAGAPEFLDSTEALAWLDEHRLQLLSLTKQAARTPGVPGELIVRLSVGLFTFYQSRGHWLDWSQVCQTALDAAAAEPDRLAEAIVRMDLGLALVDHSHSASAERANEAPAQLRRSLAEFEALDHRPGIAMCLTNLSEVVSDDLRAAIAYAERSLAINQDLADHNGQATTCENLGGLYGRAGDQHRQLAYYERSLALNERVGHDRGTASVLQQMGVAHRTAGRHQDAATALRRSAAVFHQVGDAVGEAASLEELGRLHLELGDNAAAVKCLNDGLALAEEHEDRRRQASIRRHLDAALAGPEPDPAPTRKVRSALL